MPAVLSEKAKELLSLMPPYLTDDPLVQGIIEAQAKELQRIDDAHQAIRAALFPSQAADVVLPNGATAWLASLWETLLGLPVNPTGVTNLERERRITSHIRKRQSGRGADWVATLSEAFGATPWSYEEGPGDYEVTIHIPYATGTYSAGQILALARDITPAHIDIIPAYDEGFLVGISDVGIEPL